MNREQPRVLVTAGTRPEAIKMAPVIAALRADDRVDARLAFTGQHESLMDQVLESFPLDPEYRLEIMRPGQTLYDVAQGCLNELRRIVVEYQPDCVLVQGDTASVFFSSLVAFFERVKVGHVEAGLRSGNKWSPWPEEIFRHMTDVLADFYFAPTAGARENLLREGLADERIFVTGNTVVDAVLDVGSRLEVASDPTLRAILEARQRLVLVTAHRRESFGAPLREALGAIKELALRFDDVAVLYPVHPNPNVRGAAEEVLAGAERVHLVEPLDYRDFVLALREATLVLSDSGGVQEEAPSFGTPVLVMREVTERPEVISAGVARLVGTSADRILESAHEILNGQGPGHDPSHNPFGDGRAGERIADIVASDLSGTSRRTSDWIGP